MLKITERKSKIYMTGYILDCGSKISSLMRAFMSKLCQPFWGKALPTPMTEDTFLWRKWSYPESVLRPANLQGWEWEPVMKITFDVLPLSKRSFGKHGKRLYSPHTGSSNCHSDRLSLMTFGHFALLQDVQRLIDRILSEVFKHWESWSAVNLYTLPTSMTWYWNGTSRSSCNSVWSQHSPTAMSSKTSVQPSTVINWWSNDTIS